MGDTLTWLKAYCKNIKKKSARPRSQGDGAILAGTSEVAKGHISGMYGLRE